MNERIDHVVEARKRIEEAHAGIAEHGESAMDAAALDYSEAQAHATLALVEQQRIANLIAVAAMELDLDKDEPEAVGAMYEKGRMRPPIRKALGL